MQLPLHAILSDLKGTIVSVQQDYGYDAYDDYGNPRPQDGPKTYTISFRPLGAEENSQPITITGLRGDQINFVEEHELHLDRDTLATGHEVD